MQALSPEQTQQHLATLKGWRAENGEITKTYKFKDFVAALSFVNRVGKLAESVGHHPDIDIRYNQVRLGLSTHDAGGITAKDFGLAAEADAVNDTD